MFKIHINKLYIFFTFLTLCFSVTYFFVVKNKLEFNEISKCILLQNIAFHICYNMHLGFSLKPETKTYHEKLFSVFEKIFYWLIFFGCICSLILILIYFDFYNLGLVVGITGILGLLIANVIILIKAHKKTKLQHWL